MQQRVGDRLGAAPAGARHAGGVQAADEDVAEGRPAGGVHGQHRDRARVDPVLGLVLVVLQPGLGHRGDVAGEVARGRLRRAADVRRGEVPEPGQRLQALDDVGLRGEEPLPAQPEAVDEAVDEEVGPRGVQRRGHGPVQAQEAEHALARLGRELGRLRRGDERGDHVELAPPGDLDAAREVDGAQLDRGARQRADDRPGVGGVDEQPQPGQDVLDLRALEEGARAHEPVRHRALLERDGERLALAADGAHDDPDVAGRDAGAHEPLDLAGHGLGLRALVRAAPEAHGPLPAARVDLLGQAVLDGGDHRARRGVDGARRRGRPGPRARRAGPGPPRSACAARAPRRRAGARRSRRRCPPP